MSRERGLATTTTVALLLALLCAGFAVRAVFYVPPPPEVRPLEGIFGREESSAARDLVERLARGIMSLQRSDGGFDLGADSEYSYQLESDILRSRACCSACSSSRSACRPTSSCWPPNR